MNTTQRHTASQKTQMHVHLSHALRLMALSQIELQALIEETLNENLLLSQEVSDSSYPTPVTANVREPAVYTEPSTLFSIQNPTSLRDKLMWQCDLAHLTSEEYEVAHVLIDAIDDNGYLLAPLDSLFDKKQYSKRLNTLILNALNTIQTFEPVGVGARNLKECLLIQLQALPNQDETTRLAHELVQHHLEHLHKPQPLAKKVNASSKDIEKALGLIQSLDPKPGRQEADYFTDLVMPDLKLDFHDGRPNVTLIPYPHYALKIHEPYAEPAKTHPTLAQTLQMAKQFIEQLKMRHQTLLEVGRAIIAIQKDFFTEGKLMLKPLTLQTLANELGYHPSTLSRVTTQKYIDTPRGIFELKYFFSGSIKSDEKHWASTAIKAIIEELVNTENREHPLTDDALTDLLHARGVNIARRTVTKYREALRIPSCVYRK